MNTPALLQIPINYLRAPAFILSERKLIWYCMVPYLIGILSFFVFATIAISFEESILRAIFGDTSKWLGYLLTFVEWILSLLLASVLALITLSLAGAWYIESFISYSMDKLGVRSSGDRLVVGFTQSLLRGLRDDLRRIVYVCFLLLLSLLLSFFPPLVFIPILLGAFLVGFDLVDLPLTLLGFDFASRWKIVKRYKFRITLLGGCYSLILLIPLIGVLLFPVAYQAAIYCLSSWDLEQTPVEM